MESLLKLRAINRTGNFVLGRVTGNLSIYLRVNRGVLEQGLKAREDKMQLKNRR